MQNNNQVLTEFHTLVCDLNNEAKRIYDSNELIHLCTEKMLDFAEKNEILLKLDIKTMLDILRNSKNDSEDDVYDWTEMIEEYSEQHPNEIRILKCMSSREERLNPDDIVNNFPHRDYELFHIDDQNQKYDLSNFRLVFLEIQNRLGYCIESQGTTFSNDLIKQLDSLLRVVFPHGPNWTNDKNEKSWLEECELSLGKLAFKLGLFNDDFFKSKEFLPLLDDIRHLITNEVDISNFSNCIKELSLHNLIVLYSKITLQSANPREIRYILEPLIHILRLLFGKTGLENTETGVNISDFFDYEFYKEFKNQKLNDEIIPEYEGNRYKLAFNSFEYLFTLDISKISEIIYDLQSKNNLEDNIRTFEDDFRLVTDVFLQQKFKNNTDEIQKAIKILSNCAYNTKCNFYAWYNKSNNMIDYLAELVNEEILEKEELQFEEKIKNLGQLNEQEKKEYCKDFFNFLPEKDRKSVDDLNNRIWKYSYSDSNPFHHNIDDLFTYIKPFTKVVDMISFSQMMLKKLSVDSNFGDFTCYLVGQIKAVEILLKQVLAKNYPSDIEIKSKDNTITLDLGPNPNFESFRNKKKEKKNIELGGLNLNFGRIFSNQNHQYNGIFYPNSNDSPFYYHFVRRVRNGFFHTDTITDIEKAKRLSQECSYWMCRFIDECLDFKLKLN